uniref:DNA-directed primase/polymerase protein n=1 Tax=Ditylenchus dipsaci TaxID=166011 RepID=A0A915DQP4_9BILA
MSKNSGERIIQYQLKDCRYCYNKKREHKSQNVYWSVHLDASFCVQRCFDVVDCYKFSSERFSIPNEVAEKILSKIGPVFHQLCKTVIPLKIPIVWKMPILSHSILQCMIAYSKIFYSKILKKLTQKTTHENVSVSCCYVMSIVIKVLMLAVRQAIYRFCLLLETVGQIEAVVLLE